MNGQDIALIVVASIWIIALLITGLLALKYQKKFNAYKKVRDDYDNEYHELEKTFNKKNDLLPIETNIKLPKDEYIYAIEHNVSVFSKNIKSKKKRKSNKVSRKEMMQDYDDYYGAINLKKIHSLSSSEFKMKLPSIIGDIFVTNKRILFKEKTDITSINLSDVKYCKLAVIFADRFFYPGFSLVTKDINYQVVNQKPETIIIIQTLMNDLKESEEN